MKRKLNESGIKDISVLDKRPPTGGYKYDSEKDDSPSVKFTKMIANEFDKKLKEKIAESK